MPCWSHRSEMGVCSRRWSRRMATFSWAVNRLRVFLAMGKPPLEIVAYSSGPFFPFRLKQNRLGRMADQPRSRACHEFEFKVLEGVATQEGWDLFHRKVVTPNAKSKWTPRWKHPVAFYSAIAAFAGSTGIDVDRL